MSRFGFNLGCPCHFSPAGRQNFRHNQRREHGPSSIGEVDSLVSSDRHSLELEGKLTTGHTIELRSTTESVAGYSAATCSTNWL